ncbi:MAG: deoxyribose-phosphate aldolase [Actinomycetes bacterium]
MDRPYAVRTAKDLAGRIDHTILKASATSSDIEVLCAEAAEHGFASVCVNGRWVPLAAELLAGSSSMVCTVVGFPLGAMASRAKAYEAKVAVQDGADEVDMVIDIGAMLSGDLVAVFDDIAAVVDAARPSPVKVIFENCLLTDDQKIAACVMSAAAGAAYVKTSTGTSTGGATVEDVALMRAVVGDELGVKAAGAVRSLADAEAMLAAGADRIGTSGGVAIVAGTDGSAQGDGGY